MSDTHTLDTVTLPGDIPWSDKYAWIPFDQAETRTVTGRLIVEPMAKTGGRPVTLDGLPSGNWNGAWITDTTLEALYSRLTPGRVMELILSTGEELTVTWRGTGLRVQRIDDQYPPVVGSRYCVAIDLQEVDE